MSTQNARDTHFFLAGWNGHIDNPNATTHFQQAMKSAPAPTEPLPAEHTTRSDAETMARAETTARLLLGWKYGQMPTNPDTPLRLSVHAKAQWAWNAACKLLRFIDGSAPAEVQDATSEPIGNAAPATQEAGAAQAVEPVASILTFVNGEPAKCGCHFSYSDGGGEYSNVGRVTLCAKHAGAAPQAQDVQPRLVLDAEWSARLLDGRPLVRDEMGFGDHPDLPLLDEGMKPRAFFDALGIELKHTLAEDDLSLEAHEAMNDASNWSDWTPRAPAGEGWKLVAIFDTEDGQAAWWMRDAFTIRAASAAQKGGEA